MTSWIPILAAAVAGTFAVAGYLVQKRLQRMQALSDQRREAYTMYFKTMFEGIDNRRQGGASPVADEVYWRTRVFLFASDDVVEKLGLLQGLLTRRDLAEGQKDQISDAFDTVLLAMRREIVGNTKATLADVHKLSPLLE